MYRLDSRIRYSETDEDGFLTMTGIINYFQDCSTFHSEDCGVGVEFLKEEHRAWMLSSWRILAERYPRLGERVQVVTWPYAFKGIYGYRNFAILDMEDNYLVKANSIWFLCDTGTLLPVRVREEDTAPYGAEEPPLDMGEVSRKIPVPQEFVQGDPIIVNRYHIDTNHHVNNAQYVEMARQAAGESGKIQELRAEYKKAAVLGDTIIPRVSEIEKGKVLSLCSTEGKPYAVVWMQYESQTGGSGRAGKADI